MSRKEYKINQSDFLNKLKNSELSKYDCEIDTTSCTSEKLHIKIKSSKENTPQMKLFFENGSAWLDFTVETQNSEYTLSEIDELIEDICSIVKYGMICKEFYFKNSVYYSYTEINDGTRNILFYRVNLFYFLMKKFCKRREKVLLPYEYLT